MGEIPGWIREQLQVEGWVVVESLETFDVHLGDRYADRAAALQKALAGDAAALDVYSAERRPVAKRSAT